MANTRISSETGIDKVKDGTITQADLAPNVAGNGPCFRSKVAITVAATVSVWAAISTWVGVYDTTGSMGGQAFIAPISGKYQFNATCDCMGASLTAAGVAFFVNGVQTTTVYLVAPTGSQLILPISDLLDLSAGDSVTVCGYITCSSTPAFGVYSVFSGFLARAS